MANTKPRVSIKDFIRQVRQEGQKIFWPSRKEALVTSVMVFIIALIAAIFFLMVDGLISFVIGKILG